ncbi:MAG: HAD family phosphatase [Comamonadaceae bacterium]
MKFDAVLFDCDGVLVDSEPITNGVLRELLAEAGWVLTPQDCMQIFVGRTLREERALIEANTGQPMTEAWLSLFFERRNRELDARLEVIAGAHAAVTAAHQRTGERIACASGADRFKVEMQLSKVGLIDFFAGRIFSGHEMARSKPAPDVYLAAAQHLQVSPERCLVIEDTTTGVKAGVAAGATVWAYCPLEQQGGALQEAGASRLFSQMADLPELMAQAGS